MANIYNIIILVLSALGYGFYNYSRSNIIDAGTLGMMSLLFALGVFCLVKSFQYLIISEKTMAKIISSSVDAGNFQDMGSYSRGYRYSFLIDGKEYTMPKYFYFGSRYEVGDTVKVSIVSREKKIAMPIRAVYNIIIIGVVSIYGSVSMATR